MVAAEGLQVRALDSLREADWHGAPCCPDRLGLGVEIKDKEG